jgi:hypothetical protein
VSALVEVEGPFDLTGEVDATGVARPIAAPPADNAIAEVMCLCTFVVGADVERMVMD